YENLDPDEPSRSGQPSALTDKRARAVPQTASRAPSKGVSTADWMELQMVSYQPTAVVEQAGEGCALEENMAAVRAAGRLGERPLVVLTSGIRFDSPDPARGWRDCRLQRRVGASTSAATRHRPLPSGNP